ncbi:MAG TPA: hypothetical protein VHR47_06545, partial [Bacillota bacterium]|nr:hypothetical protein [Bacillota bacterium]
MGAIFGNLKWKLNMMMTLILAGILVIIMFFVWNALYNMVVEWNGNYGISLLKTTAQSINIERYQELV